MPQIPQTRRCTSRQSSLNEDYFDGYRTPENTSHRGASLPPTPTKTSKILAGRRTAGNKPASLPPTPARQLPKPNVRSNNRNKDTVKRTTSADYTEDVQDDENYYRKTGTMSARDVYVYNEDYNYAYQSIDNLSSNVDVITYMNRGSTDEDNANYNNEVKTSYHEFPTDTYQEVTEFEDFTNSSSENVYTRKQTVQNDTFIKHNSESLEGQSDDLKDSFDTAYSSVQQNYHQQHVFENHKGYLQPAREQEVNRSCTDDKISHRITTQDTTSKTIFRTKESTGLEQSVKPYLREQGTIKEDFFPDDDANGGYLSENNDIYQEKSSEDAAYFDHQDSLESYTEEGTATNGESVEYDTKATPSHESPASVIHIDAYEEDGGLRRGSSQVTVVDPYHPSLQRSNVDPFPPQSRRASLEQHITPPRRTTSDIYEEITFPEVGIGKPSVDVYETEITRRSSVRHVTTGITKNPEVVVERSTPTEIESVDKRNELLVPEEAELEEAELISKPHRAQVTAHQRWLWAYNKIIMQLNVSICFFTISV